MGSEPFIDMKFKRFGLWQRVKLLPYPMSVRHTEDGTLYFKKAYGEFWVYKFLAAASNKPTNKETK